MSPTPAPENRIESRSNIFVVATLYWPQGSAPVRIRNLSPSGALIEGAIPAPVGSQVRLCRGRHSVSGHLVWIEANKAGLRFAASATVTDWLPSGNRGSGQLLAD